MSKVLIIRFSAIGDVAMSIPVCYSMAEHYPQDEFVLLSRRELASLFVNKPSNLKFMGADLKRKHALYHLYKDLRSEHFDVVVDLHNVLRSIVLRLLLQIGGAKASFIHKGRKEKDDLINTRGKKFAQLKHSVVRYQDVFNRLGFQAPITFTSLIDKKKKQDALAPWVGKKEGKWIGIAPFAKHQGKIYPLYMMEEVVYMLSRYENYRLFLFGGGEDEKKVLCEWETKYPRSMSVAGLFTMDKELLLMSQLDVMLAMDSANMHMASLVATPVVSIWGATHPYAGFYGFKQDINNALQIDLACRPCSVFGNKPCYRKDYACLFSISPQMVIDKVLNIL